MKIKKEKGLMSNAFESNKCPLFELCCLCIPMKIGLYLIAAHGILPTLVCLFFASPFGKTFLQERGLPPPEAAAVSYVYGALGLTVFLTNVVLAIAVLMHLKKMFSVYLWAMIFYIIGSFSVSVVISIESIRNENLTFGMMFLVASVLYVVVVVYFWLIVQSQLFTVKSESNVDTGANAGGSGSDCEGEEQEDPSSSCLDIEAEVSDAVSKMTVQDKSGDDDELSTFRQQWQRELEASPAHNSTPKTADAPNKTPEKGATDNADSQKQAKENECSDFEKARAFFLLAAELERAGCWYESIQNYKRALAINPDIELLLYKEGILDKFEEETPEEEAPFDRSQNEPDDEEEMVEGEDLLTRIQRIQTRKGVLCEPAVSTPGMHISWLPYEVLLLIIRWVVSSELDAISLERLGTTCRGLYLVARDQDIWRNVCIRTWGVECGTPRLQGLNSWRQMYLDRPRLQLHGCYISKTSYLRHGETGFQDQLYRPWFLVQYFRYLRFFPEGLVVMLTTPDEPGASVGLLRSRNIRPGHGVMVGHYRLRDDRVVIVMKKSNAEKKSTQIANTRFRSRRREPEQQEREQTFHIELQLSSPAGRRNMRLSWKRYSVCARRDQWTEFELCPGKFPPFSFSRVRHYTREASAPLSSVPVSGASNPVPAL